MLPHDCLDPNIDKYTTQIHRSHNSHVDAFFRLSRLGSRQHCPCWAVLLERLPEVQGFPGEETRDPQMETGVSQSGTTLLSVAMGRYHTQCATMLCLGCMSRLQVVGHVCVCQENTIADHCTGRWGKPTSGLYLSSSPKRVGQLRDEQPVVLRVFAQTNSWSMCW